MRLLLFLLVLANIIGVVIGLDVYWPKMANTNFLLWIFIPDCPLYVLLATLCYLGITKNSLLRTITALGLLKYGIWTIFVLFYFSNIYLSDWLGWVLVAAHVGMTSQFLLLAAKFESRDLIISTVWLLLNDFVDYVLGTHPPLAVSHLGIVPAFTFILSLAVPAFAFVGGERISKLEIIRKVKKLLGL